MRFHRFEWDAINVDHIARHRVTPNDAEGACRGDAVVLRGREGRYLVYGRTSAGRYLLVVVRSYAQGVARIITARDMTENERRFYQRRH